MPHSRYWSSSDELYVAGLARGKIYREFRRADPNLRHCVGHANMLDSINAVALNAAAQKRARKTPSASQSRPGPSPTIRKISDEYLNTQPQSVHVEDISTKAGDQCNLSLKNHFPTPNVYEEDSDSSSDSSSDDLSPPSSPPTVTVSISPVEVDDNDEYDEYGLPPHPLKRVRSEPKSDYGHAPPTFIGDVDENESPAAGMLATLDGDYDAHVSEVRTMLSSRVNDPAAHYDYDYNSSLMVSTSNKFRFLIEILLGIMLSGALFPRLFEVMEVNHYIDDQRFTVQ